MKYVLFLGDGMADEPLAELGGKTPLEFAQTPNMDRIAREGRCGTFLSLPEGFPTSSDVANLSVLGYDLSECYSGRGPLEAASRGIQLGEHDIALRCNLITAKDGVLDEYSGGHISTEEARELIAALNDRFGDDSICFYPGVSYRNLLVLRGKQFSHHVNYHKPDSSQGMQIKDILLSPASPEAQSTAALLNTVQVESHDFLSSHPVNQRRVAQGKKPANMIWLWSPGGKPRLQSFSERYGKKGAIISAVDVIRGIGVLAGMEIVQVPGATGFIDTNYEGKADAALNVLDRSDFVFVHVEGIDEVSHLGKLPEKLQAIEDFDRRLIGRFLERCTYEIAIALLPDHPVPIKLRAHTCTPVPVAIRHPALAADSVKSYSERACARGPLGLLRGDQLMRTLFS
jgi:2,3-bisphosphoglycerate-independent phosphoglycerate mutase